ncbi:hypothetical protein O6H91_07G106800 [Diphasiastrum complanatum]|uniref:Uncharacterized protein n=3 Tax=Diphasiastrum complanatum TaxID=34168 RepID=A0ACC2D8U3_DIPCM|nr:hypothetical protein O6H91_07G106800 [Diphasiastrum complanatum]
MDESASSAALKRGREAQKRRERKRGSSITKSSSSNGTSSLRHSQQQHLLLYHPLPSPLYHHSSSLENHLHPRYHPHPQLGDDGGGVQFEGREDDDDEEDMGARQHEVEEEASHFRFLHEQHRGDLFCQEQQKHDCQHDASASLLSMSSGFAIARKSEADKLSMRDDWTESATRVLLEAWGRKYVQLNRGPLKLDHWVEVAETVSKKTSLIKTEMQCKNRVDTLKKKYKLEKQKQSTMGSPERKWSLYYQMDQLLNASAAKRSGLPGAVDAGEMVKDCPPLKVDESKYLAEDEGYHTSNDTSPSFGSRDDPDITVSTFRVKPEHTNRKRSTEKMKVRSNPFAVLANALTKFSETYEKMENVKQQQLLDLEKIRMEFTRDLEMHRMQLYMQTQMELARLKHCNIDIDASVSNMSDR